MGTLPQCEGEFGHPFDILRTAYRCEGPLHRKSAHCEISHITQKLTADASRVIFIIMNPTRTQRVFCWPSLVPMVLTR